MCMKYDSIVIGSGLGGLTAAAKLAKEGKKVLVIEQHSIPGGCATSFTRQNYTIDVGLHSLDGVYSKGPKLDIFNELDVFMNVEFVKDETGFYRFFNERVDITVLLQSFLCKCSMPHLVLSLLLPSPSQDAEENIR